MMEREVAFDVRKVIEEIFAQRFPSAAAAGVSEVESAMAWTSYSNGIEALLKPIFPDLSRNELILVWAVIRALVCVKWELVKRA